MECLQTDKRMGSESNDFHNLNLQKWPLNGMKPSCNKHLVEIEDHFEKYRISDALMGIYKLVWDDFCSWFLEMIKPAYQQPIDKVTFDKAIEMLENNLKLLHPFMPFLTEEIWQHIADRTPEEALIVSTWPELKPFNVKFNCRFRKYNGSDFWN